MKSFQESYAALNESQRKAVDTVEGAVLVVAGPGSGKTEILALRVARILQETDAGANSILCLTFTDSASANMRSRLVGFIGSEAYRVMIGTFHSFAQHVAEQYPASFSGGAVLVPAEAVERTELIAEALRELPLGSVLRTGHPSQEFTYLKDVVSRIEDLKKAGIGPDALEAALAHNAALIPQIDALLAPFSGTISKKMLPQYAEAAAQIMSLPRPAFPLLSYPDIALVIGRSLAAAVGNAETENGTKPVTAWKGDHLAKEGDVQVLKAGKQQKRLEELATVYRRYQQMLAEKGLRDFDDLIVDLLEALRNDTDLRAELREQYLYILVDEYQDTNGAQAELLALLADHPANEGNPNLMVVGDDDQSIYRFHGAGIEHILSFKERYPRATVVTMAINYRSRQGILDLAREQIKEVGERLVGRIDGLTKDLVSGGTSDGAEMSVLAAGSREEERARIASLIGKRIESGIEPAEIAVIGRRHRDLEALVPHLAERGIRVSYDRQRDALADPHIVEIVEVARVALALAKNAAEADPLLPRVLSFAFWGIPRLELWKLARAAHTARRPWSEVALESEHPSIKSAVELMIEIGLRSHDAPAELLVDEIVGICPTEEGRTSPFHAYHFGADARKEDPQGFLALVASLRNVILTFRESRRGEPAQLADLVAFADLRKAHGERIMTRAPMDGTAVHLLTTHKAKGMEFDTVVILHATTDGWLGSGRGRLISFPENLGISPASDQMDDKLRGLYVAITRAKRELVFGVSPSESVRGNSEPLPLLEALPANQEDLGPYEPKKRLAWHEEVAPVSVEEAVAFQPLIADFQLTATQLNDFLNVTEAGPDVFFERHLLRFPRYRNASLRFGQAVHGVLERIALDCHEGIDLPGEEKIASMLELQLQQAEFQGRDLEQYREKGLRVLGEYVAQRGEELRSATHVEVSFSKDRVHIGEARVTGKVDVIREEEDGSLTIIDYKTGRASEDWDEKGKEVQRYANRRQLLFYALMMQASQRFAGKEIAEAKLSFIESDKEGRIVDLVLVPEPGELERVRQLIEAVYRKAIALDFPDISAYPKDMQGVLAFEDFLLTSKP